MFRDLERRTNLMAPFIHFSYDEINSIDKLFESNEL